LAALPPSTRDAFHADLLLVEATCRDSVSEGRRAGQGTTWFAWEAFCSELQADPLLPEHGPDPLHLLQVFAQCYRDGRTLKNRSKKPVRASTVADALSDIGKTITELGLPDPRKTAGGSIKQPLKQLQVGMAKQDPPPRRIKPVTLTILRQAVEMAQLKSEWDRELANILVIAFYFLCRPGEYAQLRVVTRSTPFRLCDVEFYCGLQLRPAHTAPLNDLMGNDFGQLTFNDQKNAVRGEKSGHGLSTDPLICPVRALERRCLHLRRSGAPSTAALYTVNDGKKIRNITTSHITTALRRAAASVQHITGIDPLDIQARSLRSGGATALLCARIDPYVIQMLGRWKGESMIKYLHVHALSTQSNFAKQMLDNGDFTLIPGSDVPFEAIDMFTEHNQLVPPPLRATPDDEEE